MAEAVLRGCTDEVTDFQLTEHDKAQGLWLRLRAHLEDRLADARRR